MDKKALPIIAIVVVIVVVAAVALMYTGGDVENPVTPGGHWIFKDDDEPITEGVIYKGNGGLMSDGNDTYANSTHDVLANYFSLDGKAFAGWNTKADGTGTSYVPGDHIDYGSGKTVTLYAQWADPVTTFHVTSMLSSNLGHVSLYLNGTHVNEVSIGLVPLYETGNILEVRPESGYGSDWKYTDGGVFSFDVNGVPYTLTIAVNGATGPIFDINPDNGYPTVGFIANQDVTLSISISPVREA